MLTVMEAARRLRVASRTVYDLVNEGKLRAYRIGCGRGVIRIPEESLEDFLKDAEVGRDVEESPTGFVHITKVGG